MIGDLSMTELMLSEVAAGRCIHSKTLIAMNVQCISLLSAIAMRTQNYLRRYSMTEEEAINYLKAEGFDLFHVEQQDIEEKLNSIRNTEE